MTHSAVLTAALNWRERGIIPVPLKPRSKQPAIPWGRLRRSGMPPVAVIERWFSEPANLGLLCGPASGGFVALDFDRPLFYHRWARATGLDSYTVRTGRGYHVYVRLSREVDTTLSMVGGEVKGSGYVVTAPSVHPSGVMYQALDPTAPVLELPDLDAAGIQAAEPEYNGATVQLPGSPDSPSPNRGLIDNIKRALLLLSLIHI